MKETLASELYGDPAHGAGVAPQAGVPTSTRLTDSGMSHPGAGYKSISMADQSMPSAKGTRQVTLVLGAKVRPDRTSP